MGNSQKELFYIGRISDIAKGATRRGPGPYSGDSYYSLGVGTEGNFYILFLLRLDRDKSYFKKEYDRRQKRQIMMPISFGHKQDVRYLSLRGGFYRHPKNPRLYIVVKTIPFDGIDENVQSVFEDEKEYWHEDKVKFNRLRTIRASQEPVMLSSQSLSQPSPES